MSCTLVPIVTIVAVLVCYADPNYFTLPGGLVGGPDDTDSWSDDRDMYNTAVTVSLLNNAGFSAALAGLVKYDINMAKCQQGNGFIQVRCIHGGIHTQHVMHLNEISGTGMLSSTSHIHTLLDVCSAGCPCQGTTGIGVGA